MTEELNADFWLQEQTKPKVVTIFVKELITDMAQAVVNKVSGVLEFFKQQHLEKLRLLFTVFSRDENTYDKIIDVMTPFIIE